MKAVSKSVSLPGSFWTAIEKHAPRTPGHDRSGYIRILVASDLATAGALPAETSDDPNTELLTLAEELGHAAAIAALREQIRIRPTAARAA
jgi:hypothetical protein